MIIVVDFLKIIDKQHLCFDKADLLNKSCIFLTINK